MSEMIIRSYTTPLELHRKANEICKLLNTSLNKAHSEGLALWVKKNESVLKKQGEKK